MLHLQKCCRRLLTLRQQAASTQVGRLFDVFFGLMQESTSSPTHSTAPSTAFSSAPISVATSSSAASTKASALAAKFRALVLDELKPAAEAYAQTMLELSDSTGMTLDKVHSLGAELIREVCLTPLAMPCDWLAHAFSRYPPVT